jgi:hypothetical protein
LFLYLLDPIPHEWAGHAVSAPASLAQLEPGNNDYFDTGLVHIIDGVGIALVGQHDALPTTPPTMMAFIKSFSSFFYVGWVVVGAL